MVNSIVNELIGVLNGECEIYKEILSLAYKKKEIIIKGRVTELENLVKLEQSLLVKVGKLDRQREDLTRKLTELLGIDESEATITNICSKLDKNEADQLLAIKETFQDVLQELRDVNELNSRLVKNSLDYINFSINLLGAAGNLNNSYMETGQPSGGQTKHFFDYKL